MDKKELRLIEVLKEVLSTKNNIDTDDEAIIFDTKLTWLIKQLEDIQSSVMINHAYNKLKQRARE